LSNLDKKILNLKNSILTMNINQINKRRVTLDEAANAKSKLLEAVVGQAIRLRKTGNDYVGSCPFHEERTPSLHIFTKTNTYKCFGRCDKGGNSISFAMDFYHLGFVEAVRYLNNNY